jgi:transposase
MTLGPYPKLEDSKLSDILEEMRKRSEQRGERMPTARQVAEYIEEKYGVKYHHGNLWRRMANLGWKFPKRGPVRLPVFKPKKSRRK